MNSKVKIPSLPTLSVRRLLYVGVFCAALAVIVNLAIYVVTGNLFSVDYVVPPPPNSNDAFIVSAANVVLDTVIMALGATLVIALFSRFSPRPLRLFIIVSSIVLGLSFIFPLLLSVEIPMKFSLGLMHVATAAIMVGGFLRFARS
jgi:hypothetical protein